MLEPQCRPMHACLFSGRGQGAEEGCSLPSRGMGVCIHMFRCASRWQSGAFAERKEREHWSCIFFGRCTALSMFVEFLATSAARNWMCWLEMGGNKFFMSSCLQSISEPREKVTFSLIIKSCSVLCFLKSSGFGDCKDWEKPAISVAVRDVILKREELQSSSSWVPTPLPFHSNNCFLFFSCSLSSYEIGPNCSTFCSVT